AQIVANRARRWPKLLLTAQPQHHQRYAAYQESYRDRCRDLRSFLFVHGCFDGTDLGYFFLLVIVEIRMDESNHAQNKENDSENDDKALHSQNLSQRCDLHWRCRQTHGPAGRRSSLFDLQSLTSGWPRRRLSWRPWLRWRPCGDAWSSVESRALRRSIRPS